MNIRSTSLFRLVLALCFLAALGLTASAQIAVKGETVYPMNGPAIKDGVVLIRDGKIEKVGPAKQVQIPADYKVVSAKVVTPGLIDSHSVVGLSGYLNAPGDQDQLDRSHPVQPELRAIDAYNGRERLIEYLRGYGVTVLHTGPAPGALVPGQTMVVKTSAETVDQGVLNPATMVCVTLGANGLADAGRAPGTRSKEIAMLRAELIRAREYAVKMSAPEDKRPPRDLKLDVLVRVLNREEPLLVTAHKANDMLSALRLAKEFNVRLVFDGAAEAHLIVKEIKDSGFPVILHATMLRTGGEAENASFETASILRNAGIPVAIQSGYEAYVPKTRVVLFEAAVAAANGLKFEEALATITIDAAKILGVADRVGSLEPGKDADVAMFDGDPFEYTSHAVGVIINGKIVSSSPR